MLQWQTMPLRLQSTVIGSLYCRVFRNTTLYMSPYFFYINAPVTVDLESAEFSRWVVSSASGRPNFLQGTQGMNIIIWFQAAQMCALPPRDGIFYFRISLKWCRVQFDHKFHVKAPPKGYDSTVSGQVQIRWEMLARVNVNLVAFVFSRSEQSKSVIYTRLCDCWKTIHERSTLKATCKLGHFIMHAYKKVTHPNWHWITRKRYRFLGFPFRFTVPVLQMSTCVQTNVVWTIETGSRSVVLCQIR